MPGENLSIVITGRNDDYDGNFNERLSISLTRNIASLPDAEFIFVEWNPILSKPLTCEFLRKYFKDSIRYYVGHPAFHNQYCTFDEFNEYPPKNVGIRKSTRPFVICMNSDVIFCPDLVENLCQPLKSKIVYRATRIDIWPDYIMVRFPLHPKFILCENRGYMNAAGDFLMMDRDSWFKATGYMEAYPEQRLHKDAEMLWRMVDINHMPCEFIGTMTHWRHQSSWSNGFKRDKVGDVHWDFKQCHFMKNKENWGLDQSKEILIGGTTWLVPEDYEQLQKRAFEIKKEVAEAVQDANTLRTLVNPSLIDLFSMLIGWKLEAERAGKPVKEIIKTLGHLDPKMESIFINTCDLLNWKE